MENKYIKESEKFNKVKNYNCDRLHDYILKDLKERLDEDYSEESKEKIINRYSKRKIFNEWLCWNGFVGFVDEFTNVVENIYEVDLSEDED